jgi:8-amino-7-oxononanoate synthase
VKTFSQQLQKSLADRKSQGLYRSRKTLASAQGTEVRVNDKTLINFCSNDYLGLANHPEVIAACKRGLDHYGIGSGASHLVVGHSHAHHALEEELATFTGRSRALLFSSGYMANLGVLTSLASKKDCVFEDKLNHASLLDGGLFSGAVFKRFPHLDLDQLASLLNKQLAYDKRFIVSDGVFSMDGDFADLPGLVSVAERFQSQLMLDDAHGFGVLGKKGGGLVEYYRDQGYDINENNLPILVGTLGKAFGTQGAFVAGSEALIENLIQYCRPYIYTTAISPALAEATRTSLQLIQKENWRREHLQALITAFRSRCQVLGYLLTDSMTPIQGLLLGDTEKSLQASRLLENEGIFVTAIRPPTVPQGTARLRITFSASHTPEQLDLLLAALEKIQPLLYQEQENAAG